MTIHDLMDLENKLLIIDNSSKDKLSFSGMIVLQELLKRIGDITNLALVLVSKNKLKEGFTNEINPSDIDYILGKYTELDGYKEIEKLF